MVINTGFYMKFCEIDVATCKSKLLADFTNIQCMHVHLNIAFLEKKNPCHGKSVAVEA